VLEKLEFEAFLARLGVFLSTQELRCLHNHFDQNKDGAISCGEFMATLKVSLPTHPCINPSIPQPTV